MSEKKRSVGRPKKEKALGKMFSIRCDDQLYAKLKDTKPEAIREGLRAVVDTLPKEREQKAQ